MHFVSVPRFRLKGVLGSLCLLLSNEVFGVQITTQMPDRVQDAMGLSHIDLLVMYYGGWLEKPWVGPMAIVEEL